MTKVWFVRHGDKANSQDHPYPSLPLWNPSLTPLGHAQAQAVADYLADAGITRVGVTQLLRTQQTAAPLAVHLSLEPEELPNLFEINFGEIEMASEEELTTRYADFYARYLARDQDYRYPGGETGAETQARQQALFDELADRGENAAMFCHEGYFWLLQCTVLGLPPY